VRYDFTPGLKPSAQRDPTFDMRSKSLLETTPLFEVRDEAARTCGVYDSNGAPALALRRFESHTSIYSAVGNLPAALYREIARAAGVHIYYEGRDPVYINSRLFGIHMQVDAAPTITFPSRKPMHLEELFEGGVVRAEKGTCQLPLKPGATKLYLLADATINPRVALPVSDDGNGFEPAQAAGPHQGHFGLQGMRERARSPSVTP
jgi:hypothetical protein